MINKDAKKILKESMWDLATCSNNPPNVVPVAFKDITNNDKLVIGDVFLETTLKNLEGNPNIAISAYDAKSLVGYQIKGTTVVNNLKTAAVFCYPKLLFLCIQAISIHLNSI